MSASVGAAVDQIDVRKEAFSRPHSPVCVTVKPRLSLLKKLVMDAPQKLPTEPIIGPLRLLLVAWNAGKLVRAAVQSARRDPSWDNTDQALAEAYRASANLWEAEIRPVLPALAPDTIRRAAREFSTYTATSTDGFAMRHFALLSDDALTLVSQLFKCMEMLGTIP